MDIMKGIAIILFGIVVGMITISQCGQDAPGPWASWPVCQPPVLGLTATISFFYGTFLVLYGLYVAFFVHTD